MTLRLICLSWGARNQIRCHVWPWRSEKRASSGFIPFIQFMQILKNEIGPECSFSGCRISYRRQDFLTGIVSSSKLWRTVNLMYVRLQSAISTKYSTAGTCKRNLSKAGHSVSATADMADCRDTRQQIVETVPLLGLLVE